jgi:hypothetical protein
MRHPAIDRAPWRFLEGDVDGIAVEADRVVFTYKDAPSLYAPSDLAISIAHNLATISEDLSRLPLVAASLGPLLSDTFASGYSEALTEWNDAAELMRESIAMVDAQNFEPLSETLTRELNRHGELIVIGNQPDWTFNYRDLIGAGVFEVAEDMFAAIAGKPRTYIECQACTRVLRRVRKDQLFCSRACTSKGHRKRIETRSGSVALEGQQIAGVIIERNQTPPLEDDQ